MSTILRVDNLAIRPEEHAYLFTTCGWHVPELGHFARAGAGSYFHVAVRRDDGSIVGYGRLVSDGGLHAWIHDVIVVPELQGRGIGRLIMEQLIDRARSDGIPYLGLFAARGKREFYEKFGFRSRPDDAPGMFLWSEPD